MIAATLALCAGIFVIFNLPSTQDKLLNVLEANLPNVTALEELFYDGVQGNVMTYKVFDPDTQQLVNSGLTSTALLKY